MHAHLWNRSGSALSASRRKGRNQSRLVAGGSDLTASKAIAVIADYACIFLRWLVLFRAPGASRCPEPGLHTVILFDASPQFPRILASTRCATRHTARQKRPCTCLLSSCYLFYTVSSQQPSVLNSQGSVSLSDRRLCGLGLIQTTLFIGDAQATPAAV